ncbi:hypothetical protein Belba_3749 [Belliella baltica DSM 15883]|uniref:Uncharacterized protein n=2 Tax=Belliella TaxID=232244 RepID=I3ZAG4_BELBD|nr:hypothetical protein Belba_3749 [Belliella baltica DSM 15883]
MHHAEIGTLVGTNDQGTERINFSIQSFHGFQIDPHNQIGFFVGVDTYPEFVTTQVHYLLTDIQVFGVLLPSVVY